MLDAVVEASLGLSSPLIPHTLHLTHAYHQSSGGIRTMYDALLERAERDGRRMTLVVPGAESRVESRGRHTKVVFIAAARSPIVDRRYRLLLPHRFLAVGRGPLWRLLETERPDLVEVCDKYSLCYFAGLIRRFRPQRPALVGLSCERLDDNVGAFVSRSGLGRSAAALFLRHVYVGQFDAHIANSPYTAAELESAMVLRHRRPVYVSPMGVDPLPEVGVERAGRMARELMGRVKDIRAQLVVYAGRLSPEKRVEMLPHVMAALHSRVRPVHLIVAGDGPSRSGLERSSEALAAGRVHFLGHVHDRADLAALLAQCEAFLHPNDREPFGIGPLEAMSAQVPVVLPARGGVLAYATTENAWLSEPTAGAFARTVHACLDQPRLREARVQAARLTALAHSWDAAAARLFQCYDTIHRERGNGGSVCGSPPPPQPVRARPGPPV